MPAITFFGASDDLVEVAGAVNEEYNDDDVLLLLTSALTGGGSRQSYIRVKFENTGTWSVALYPVDEDMPGHKGSVAVESYSAYLTVGVENPFTLVRVQR